MSVNIIWPRFIASMVVFLGGLGMLIYLQLRR